MFIFEAIAGGVLFDVIKEGLKITAKYIKGKLKTSVLENLTDDELATIVDEVNGMNEETKTDMEKFKIAVNTNEKLVKIFSWNHSDVIVPDNKIEVVNSIIEKSPIINSAKGDIAITYGDN